MVSMTNTLHNFFGSGLVVKNRGFIINDLASNFEKDRPLNLPGPNKHVRTTMSPLFILDQNGEPFVAAGTPGGSRIPNTMVQICSNIIDFEMDIQAAIDQGRIFQDYSGPLYIEGNIDPRIAIDLEERGHIIEYRRENDEFFGGAQGVMIEKDGTLHGGADSRRDGKAIGY